MLQELSEECSAGHAGFGADDGTGGGTQEAEGHGILPASHYSVLPYPLIRKNSGGSQTKSEALLNLVNSLLGPGLLAMPKAMSETGVLCGLTLIGALAFANRYTLLQVLSMRDHLLEETSYPEIGRHVFGQQGQLAVLMAYVLFSGGLLVAYFVVLADILSGVSFLATVPHWLLVWLAVVVCAPGAALRSLRYAPLFSNVCMVGVYLMAFVLMVVCVGEAASGNLVEAPLSDGSKRGPLGLLRTDFQGLLAGVSLFTLQFSAQAGGIEAMSRIEVEESMGGGEHESSMPVAEALSTVGFTVAVLFAAVTGVTGYYRFGEYMSGDVLLNLGSVTPYLALRIARGAYATALVIAVAYLVTPCRAACIDILALRRRDHAADSEAMPTDKFRRATVIILCVCASIACFVRDLAELLQLLGASAGMALAFIFPCAFLIEFRRRQQGLPIICSENAAALVLIALGCFVVLCTGLELLMSPWQLSAPADGGSQGHRATTQHLADAVGGNPAAASQMMSSPVVPGLPG